MPRNEPKLSIEIPRPEDERPVWSRVGVVAATGFIIGVAWPRLAGVQIGPNVPGDYKPAAEAASAKAPTAKEPEAATAAAAPPPQEPAAQNRQLVLVGPGTIAKCADKKGDKVESCGKLAFDPIALPKLKELSKCPAAVGLEGKLSLGFEIDFEKKDVHVVKGKKTTLPSSTVQGVMQCAAQELAGVSLDDIPHEHRKYTLFYGLTFYPPNKHPSAEGEKGDEEKAEGGEGGAANEGSATGSATVAQDTAFVRKTPRDGEIVARLVRGTKVKLLAKQNEWYRVESGPHSGWIYRGALGL